MHTVAKALIIACVLGFSVAKAQDALTDAPVPASTMVKLEHQDRRSRLVRLAQLKGILPPIFSEVVLAPDQHHISEYPVDIPVLRVGFNDQVFFDFNKSELKPEAKEILELIAEALRKDVPDVAVLIAGYTDAIGSRAYNLDLGLRRAHAVASLLVSLGVAKAQVYTVSFGKDAPIADNATEAGRAANRRVEFLFAAHLDAIKTTLALSESPRCLGGENIADTCTFKIDHATLTIETNSDAPKPTSLGSQSPASVSFSDTKTVIDLRSKPVAINPR